MKKRIKLTEKQMAVAMWMYIVYQQETLQNISMIAKHKRVYAQAHSLNWRCDCLLCDVAYETKVEESNRHYNALDRECQYCPLSDYGGFIEGKCTCANNGSAFVQYLLHEGKPEARKYAQMIIDSINELDDSKLDIV